VNEHTAHFSFQMGGFTDAYDVCGGTCVAAGTPAHMCCGTNAIRGYRECARCHTFVAYDCPRFILTDDRGSVMLHLRCCASMVASL
jgi:hypothetical protein